MSLADIKAKISAESQAEIQAIESEADEKVRQINQELNAEVKSVKDSYASRFAKEEPEVLRRREIVAGIDANKLDLGVRRRLVDDAFAASLRKLADLPADACLKFASRLLKEAVSSGHEAVVVGKDEKHLNQGWLDGYNAEHGTSLTLSQERLPISGGFVLRDEKIDTNCSWEMLLEDVRPEIESEVVKKLFS